MWLGPQREHQILVKNPSLKVEGRRGIIKSIQDTPILMKSQVAAHRLCHLEEQKELIQRNKEFRIS